MLVTLHAHERFTTRTGLHMFKEEIAGLASKAKHVRGCKDNRRRRRICGKVVDFVCRGDRIVTVIVQGERT